MSGKSNFNEKKNRYTGNPGYTKNSSRTPKESRVYQTWKDNNLPETFNDDDSLWTVEYNTKKSTPKETHKNQNEGKILPMRKAALSKFDNTFVNKEHLESFTTFIKEYILKFNCKEDCLEFSEEKKRIFIYTDNISLFNQLLNEHNYSKVCHLFISALVKKAESENIRFESIRIVFSLNKEHYNLLSKKEKVKYLYSIWTNTMII